MVIDKVGGINDINHLKKVKAPKVKETREQNDSLSISSEAQKLSQVEQIRQEVLKASDIRREKVEAIKKKIADGTFDKEINSKEVLGKIADIIAPALLNPLD